MSTKVYTLPAMLVLKFSDRLPVCPVFQVIVDVEVAESTRVAQLRPGPVRVQVPQMRAGALMDVHHPNRYVVLTVAVCGWVKVTVKLVGGAHTRSPGAASADSVVRANTATRTAVTDLIM
ncbi:hypothetical protein [Streptomyces parvus]|uniref:hypothetical protein n=1 Tax=Streptomyces parvus TaxID=66428 RepID=UPI00381FE46F